MFSTDGLDSITVVDGEFSYGFVVLSVVIACVSAYVALSMNQRMQQNSFFHKNFWLVLASFAMGLGIWSMHFIGMSAFMIPVEMSYDTKWTFISMVPAILASYLAFYFANRPRKSLYPILSAGLIMGFGISAMHYIGMAAMVMSVDYYYKTWMFIASILVAVAVSYVALYVFSNLQRFMGNLLIKIVTAILMGGAISSMHYIGMAAVVFYTDEPVEYHMHAHEMDMGLVGFVAAGMLLILLISGLTSVLDRYVDHRMSHFDSLTLFPNQRQFEKDINQQLTAGSLTVLHLRNLAAFTNGQGFGFGDQLVAEIGHVIQKNAPAHTRIYRLEENRFAVLNLKEQSVSRAKSAMQRVLNELSKPLEIVSQSVIVEMTAAFSYIEKKNGWELFSNAIAVLEHPSVQGRNEVIEYDSLIHTYSFESQIIAELEQAKAEGQLYVVYQPKICAKTLRVNGAEALIRWKHPVHGFISPAVFIPLLEKHEKVCDLTDWIVQQVCAQIASWSGNHNNFGPISINIPGIYLTSPKLMNVIKAQLAAHGIDPAMLELEITETSVIHDIDNAIAAVSDYRKLGLSVALDDFGTGLSSLSYLRKLPVNTIKIDKSFIDEVPTSLKDAGLLSAIVDLCASLKLAIIIEGVEAQEQIDFLHTLSADLTIQGYYFSKPLTAADFKKWTVEQINKTAG
ncbi:bifunctional diguanylate cyclase/phosphodiesterase [Jeotgalibacillus terrae]|uniref:EAL domain-containing protein n=1 Tax=Jeotgalibacillus terrae TaxID=587735 RepID=A0ABW5ZIM2_9BACL|nr:EAL domain-containing protein [Jeotgalibacillus terrae]MBM7579717.1 EAL domain-containing protein (putative c-di-GMP-specific phosphodiesterase class I)/NO-binding membrane sensor protein with MHYT domain [Jeotgalibacillus terrae]